ncbi:MAG: PAS domain-containing protein [Nitriliruptoraceae bacterium]|nr:PAS domain-containing protein [Nitriliruptoraceae bacterium]
MGEHRPEVSSDLAGLVLDRLPVAVAITAEDGTLLRCNGAYAALHGSTVEALTGSNLLQLLHPDDRPASLPESQHTIGAGDTSTFDERHVRLDDGSVHWVTVTVQSLVDDSGEVIAYSSTCVDIDEERRIRADLDEASWLRREAGRIAGFGAWSLRQPGDRLTWSPEVFEVMGVDPEDPPGPARSLAFYVPTDRARIAASTERCLEQGVAFDLEATVVNERGERLEVRVTAEPRRDAQGRITAIAGSFQDVTALVRARESSRRASQQLAATLRHMSDGVAVYDRDWRITYINPAGERLVGRERTQLLGRVVWDAIPELVGTEVERQYRRAMATGEPVLNERLAFPLTGRTYRLSALPDATGGMTVYLRDITIEVIEQDRLREMASAEHAAAEELRSLDRMKNAFITAVSHELRTPLTVIRGMADTLVRLRGAPDVDPETRTKVEEALAHHAARLGQLLDDLLDTDRLVRGVLVAERREVDVVATAREIIASSPVAARVHLDAPAQLEVAVDAVLVERCLRNLLENAAKYAGPGPIEVELRSDGADGFLLAVADEGPGIPPDHHERVFEPFHRVLEHPQPGTGIGLSLVAEFARLHGGSARVDPATERGTRIVVSVPAG